MATASAQKLNTATKSFEHAFDAGHGDLLTDLAPAIAELVFLDIMRPAPVTDADHDLASDLEAALSVGHAMVKALRSQQGQRRFQGRTCDDELEMQRDDFSDLVDQILKAPGVGAER